MKTDERGEAGVAGTRGFRVLGWDADHAPSHLLKGTKTRASSKL